jgi:hypothetical protein
MPKPKPRKRSRPKSRARIAASLIRKHFRRNSLDKLVITERTFPFRVRADLQCALSDVVADGFETSHFSGLRKEFVFGSGITFAECLGVGGRDCVTCSPPQYEEIDIGADSSIRCLHNGLWLLRRQSLPLALVMSHAGRHDVTGFRIEVAVPNTVEGVDLTQDVLRRLELAVERSTCYRGKILTLEKGEEYDGRTAGIRVQRLREVNREHVILPSATLELLERNVIDFVRRRPELAARRLPVKKGLLFYGPPGTGKTHTIHYLTRALPGHTTLIITAEQVAFLDQYMTLARLLQPSIVVLEDVDLIARDRSTLNGACEEVLLNKLLNQMDGLKEDAEILFILTTNRPQTLEVALASRPGRIDQAIEFPLPDAIGRRKMLKLYAAGLAVPDSVADVVVRKTDNVSGAFIKELMRRAGQFQIERDGQSPLTVGDVDAALDELLVKGGSFNRVLLGAHGPNVSEYWFPNGSQCST